MTLPVDWAFKPDHLGLDESGRLATGEETLADWALTVAMTAPGGLPEDGSFGAGIFAGLANGSIEPDSFAARLRGHLLEDDRVEEVGLRGETRAGVLSLPVTITPSDPPHNLSGELTPELIEEILVDMGLEEGLEA